MTFNIYIRLTFTMLVMGTICAGVTEAKEWECLSKAQYQCLDLSSDLVAAMVSNQPDDDICRKFGVYNKCILSRLSDCRNLEENEEKFYVDRYVTFYKTKHKCELGEKADWSYMVKSGSTLSFGTNIIVTLVTSLLFLTCFSM